MINKKFKYKFTFNNVKENAKIFVSLSIIVIVIFTIILFNLPINEKITCNSNYKCIVEKTYYLNRKRYKTFYITSQSSIIMKKVLRKILLNKKSFIRGYRYYAIIETESDSINLFYFPICPIAKIYDNDSFEKACNPYANYVIQNFSNYKENINNTDFTLTSLANSNYYRNDIIFLIVIFLFIFLWCYLTEIGFWENLHTLHKKYKNFQKRQKKKKKIN